jgi:membrane associated rhomboid family serine protease
MSSQNDLPPNPREAKRRSVPLHWSFYPVTVGLIAICIVVAAASRIGENTRPVQFLFFAERQMPASLEEAQAVVEEWQEEIRDNPAALSDPEMAKEIMEKNLRRHNFDQIQKGEAWRLFTPMFLHFGIMHILFNMMWLWDFGRILESRFRSGRFLLLVLFTSLAANVAQAMVSHAGFGGMSGVNYGLFGFILIRQKFHPAGDIRLNPQTTPWLLIWLVVCFTGVVGPVANAAHVAGLVSGGVIGWINAMMGGGWELMKRRRRFQAALAHGDNFLHRCAVCRRTEKDDPDLDFRIGGDGEEYCTDHLPKSGAQ